MRARTTFAEVLDEALRETGHEEPAWNGASLPISPAPAPPFLFMNALPRFRPQAAGRRLHMLDGVGETRPHGRPVNPQPPSPQPTRTLTSTEQHAFDELQALGAHLRVDFTLPELRRAFRSLARHYHPDRHPSSTPEESSRLSKLFARLNHQYRCLLAVVDR